MPEIDVRPAAVAGAAATLTAGAAQVQAALDALAAATGAADATGSPAAAASYARMHATWARALEVLVELTGELGAAAGEAAGAYTATDRSAMPEGMALARDPDVRGFRGGAP